MFFYNVIVLQNVRHMACSQANVCVVSTDHVWTLILATSKFKCIPTFSSYFILTVLAFLSQILYKDRETHYISHYSGQVGICLSLKCRGMKHWTDGIKEGCSQLYSVYLYAIGLLVPNCNLRLLNEYLSENWTLCSSLWRVNTPWILRLSSSSAHQ
jgi:hypothetical protein